MTLGVKELAQDESLQMQSKITYSVTLTCLITTRKWVYARATNMMYLSVFGMEAVALEAKLGCERNKSRDNLTAKCLKKIDAAENAICSLIDNQDIEPIEAVERYCTFFGIKPTLPEKR
ncbi:KilA-N domain-containing protein [Nodularia phage vB_NspS-kac68v162]|uniref:KilA-N domain-containing protein n=2 Tax=Ravarandavirus kac68v161 TaxID=2845690 RepID=A0A482MJ97_9CAUD|nr:KilA-N domain-containing protein [Nodularia phage vB_NspS-kac68v161]QBQ73666.1 KilA-N domain-containing protein [Nodularia phage vB_NspS-kac68v161]QBQ73864.1 KilA-N domain-containing protein [Nodularia phage vB_NspS-kac68v162]